MLSANWIIFQLYHSENELHFDDDDDDDDDEDSHFELDKHAELEFNSASSLKQQSAGRHVAPLWHIILIPSQPVFARTSLIQRI